MPSMDGGGDGRFEMRCRRSPDRHRYNRSKGGRRRDGKRMNVWGQGMPYDGCDNDDRTAEAASGSSKITRMITAEWRSRRAESMGAIHARYRWEPCTRSAVKGSISAMLGSKNDIRQSQ